MASEQIRERLVRELTDPLLALGLDLEGLELSPAGRRRVLRVAVDKDGGVTLDDVAEATKEVSRLLDDSDVMGQQPYVLEVSSPGTDRPLTHARHWRRNRGRLVAVTTTDGSTRTGRILESREDAVVLDVDGERLDVPLAEVAKARVEVELNRTSPAGDVLDAEGPAEDDEDPGEDTGDDTGDDPAHHFGDDQDDEED